MAFSKDRRKNTLERDGIMVEVLFYERKTVLIKQTKCKCYKMYVIVRALKKSSALLRDSVYSAFSASNTSSIGKTFIAEPCSPCS